MQILVYFYFQIVEKKYFNKDERGNGIYGDIALDDIKMEYGPCPNYGSCTFENNDYCDWHNVYDKRDDFDWEFGSYQTGTTMTGPS